MKPARDDREFSVHKGSQQAHPGTGAVGLRPLIKGVVALVAAAAVIWWLVTTVGSSDGTTEVANGQQRLNQQLLEAAEAADEASRR